jgi:uncharacterized membrane protein
MSETAPDKSPVPPPESSAGWNLRSQVILCYVLFLIAWMNGITAFIGVIIAFVKRSDAVGTVWHSHFQNLITVFFATLAVFVLAMLSWPLVLATFLSNGFAWPFPAYIGIPFLIWMVGFPLFALWYLYRLIRGLLRALDERAY